MPVERAKPELKQIRWEKYQKMQKMFVYARSITRDDTGLKVVKSLRLLCVFLWEGKSYPSYNFHGETVNLIKHQRLFSEAEAGAVEGAWLTTWT